MKPRSSNQMRVALVVLAVVAAVFFIFFFQRFEGLTARSTTIGMYDYLKPIPEGNKWTSEVRSKFLKTINQIPGLDPPVEEKLIEDVYEKWALQSEAEYYITNRVFPLCQYVQNYINNNPDFITNIKYVFGKIPVTNDNASQIWPNRIVYFYLNNHNFEANLKPLSYQYFMGTALPPVTVSDAAISPMEKSGISSSSSSSVSELRARTPTKR